MSRAFCCEVCDTEIPKWRIERIGDAVITWACVIHLSLVCERLQRGFEVTQLVVKDAVKLRRHAEMSKAMAEESAP